MKDTGTFALKAFGILITSVMVASFTLAFVLVLAPTLFQNAISILPSDIASMIRILVFFIFLRSMLAIDSLINSMPFVLIPLTLFFAYKLWKGTNTERLVWTLLCLLLILIHFKGSGIVEYLTVP